ncbi:MAG TPA: type II toxin-antitoxin system VapB family antitoxin [Terriglobales bacterium]|nr:type II toxin-antitoxin system VapB family antitoxin [Terriglobales bacterium]
MVRVRKKTMLLDQALLDQARRLLGARNDTEAVKQALEEVVRRQRFIEGLERLARLGPIDTTRIDR